MEGLLTTRAKHPLQRLLKRVFDLLFVFFFLPVFLILVPLIGFLIKLDSRGPVFYRSTRIGREGKPFQCWKFRTMIFGADAHSLAQGAKDERITAVGRWLRQTSLDELPQILNILKGEMSLVGPRPAIEALVREYNSHQKQRLSMTPGLTGWPQVNGRNALPYLKRLDYDVWYVQHWSLWLDVKILFRTPFVVLAQRGIYDLHPLDFGADRHHPASSDAEPS